MTVTCYGMILLGPKHRHEQTLHEQNPLLCVQRGKTETLGLEEKNSAHLKTR